MRVTTAVFLGTFAAAMLFVILAAPLGAENWPSWRGPTQNGISIEKNLPVEWSRTKNVAWTLPLPGPAGASPVVWDDLIYLTSLGENGADLLLLCVSTDGRELWRRQLGSGNENARGDEGNWASPSPVTDGRHVWSMMGSGDVACFTPAGKPVWHINLQERYGRFQIQFGMSSTPVLYNNRLYVQLIHGDGQATTQEALVACLDGLTGEEIWREDRVTGATAENEHSYASPILYDFEGLRFLISHGADYTIAHDLDDGSEIWRMGGLNPRDDPEKDYHPTLRFVASPAAAAGIVVIPTAKREPVYAIRPDLKGDLTGNKQALLWKYPRNTPDVPSPLIHGGLVYLCREDGNLLCLDAKTGEELYHERTHVLRHRASPVYADGHIYTTARDGVITVTKAGRDFEIVAQNELGEDMASSPVISNGTIYLRTFDALWAIREGK
ncbi:MAG: PQQ-binding-like beta-propeller repeat protein [Planctomycetes bacterium]|nr:PQQ-binding-like beta-propeller repeat protein [Planctomycetota bacterium]